MAHYTVRITVWREGCGEPAYSWGGHGGYRLVVEDEGGKEVADYLPVARGRQDHLSALLDEAWGLDNLPLAQAEELAVAIRAQGHTVDVVQTE